MDVNKLDNIVDNILSVKPILYKNLIKPELVASIIPAGSYHLFLILEKYITLSMTEIGKELAMPKPNVTSLVDKLISLGFVERMPDAHDRRIINVKLTNSGHKAIEQAKEYVMNYIRKKLLVLSDSELELLSSSLQNVKEILLKVI
ncbi:MAG: MarR family transcriptional regulator [FCB group bacterium]|jgi:DNA-binding MarR family transcriptional regulator